MSVIGWLWLAIGVAGVVDAYRHSAADWSYADRRRAFWAIFMFVFGPIFVPIYALTIRPRFPKADDISASFRKVDP